jgi:hypothetical protein
LTSERAAAAPATAVVDVLGQEARRKAGGERDGRRERARWRGHRALRRLNEADPKRRSQRRHHGPGRLRSRTSIKTSTSDAFSM